MIFDSHAHYDDEAFDGDRESLLASFPEAGIGRVVNIGSSLETTGKTLALTKQYPFLYGAAGVHPSETGELTEENFPRIKEALEEPKMIAVGEIGLDYHWEEPDRETQKKWFLRQLALAQEMEKPVVIHSRDAAKDTLDLMREAGGPSLRAVIHCFSYGPEMAREFLNMGYFLGIGGVVTFSNAKKLKEVVRLMPMERMLLETDCPYLSPAPNRGKRNSSLNLPYVARAIGELKGIPEEEVERVTFENACRFYRIGQ